MKATIKDRITIALAGITFLGGLFVVGVLDAPEYHNAEYAQTVGAATDG